MRREARWRLGGGEGTVGEEAGVPAVRHRLRGRPGQRVEVPVHLRQARRRFILVLIDKQHLHV